MSQTLVYTLLFVALVLPLPGALLLRLLGAYLGERGLAVGTALLCVSAIASALVLARADIGALRVGDLTLLEPSSRRTDNLIPVEEYPSEQATTFPPLPTLTPRPSPEPSATPAPTATPQPVTGSQRYTVQDGDTFRAIAERFGVSVADLLQANGMTAEQADTLRIGQELVIP